MANAAGQMPVIAHKGQESDDAWWWPAGPSISAAASFQHLISVDVLEYAVLAPFALISKACGSETLW